MRKKPKVIRVQNGIAIAIEYCCICEIGYHVRKPLDDIGMSSSEICPSCSQHIMLESYDPDINHLYESYDSYNGERDEYNEEDFEDFDETEEWDSC